MWEAHGSDVIIVVLGITKVMGVKAASESLLTVTFDNLVFDVGLVFLVQVVEDHGGEQACDTGADDANFKMFGTFVSSWKSFDDRGKLIAVLRCWLCEREQGPTC